MESVISGCQRSTLRSVNLCVALMVAAGRHVSVQTAAQQIMTSRRECNRKYCAAVLMSSVSFIAQLPCRSVPEPNGSVRAAGREHCAVG